MTLKPGMQRQNQLTRPMVFLEQWRRGSLHWKKKVGVSEKEKEGAERRRRGVEEGRCDGVWFLFAVG